MRTIAAVDTRTGEEDGDRIRCASAVKKKEGIMLKPYIRAAESLSGET